MNETIILECEVCAGWGLVPDPIPEAVTAITIESCSIPLEHETIDVCADCAEALS